MNFIDLFKKKRKHSPTKMDDHSRRFILFASEMVALLRDRDAQIADLKAKLAESSIPRRPARGMAPCIIINAR